MSDHLDLAKTDLESVDNPAMGCLGHALIAIAESLAALNSKLGNMGVCARHGALYGQCYACPPPDGIMPPPKEVPAGPCACYASHRETCPVHGPVGAR